MNACCSTNLTAGPSPETDLAADLTSGEQTLRTYGKWLLFLFALVHPLFLIPPWFANSYCKFIWLNLFSVLMMPFLLTLIPNRPFLRQIYLRQARGLIAVAVAAAGFILWSPFFSISIFYLFETLVLLGILISAKQLVFLNRAPWRAVFFLTVVSIYTTLVSFDPGTALWGFCNTYTGFITFIQLLLLWISTLALLRKESDCLILLNFLLAGSLLVSLISIGQYLGYDLLPKAAYTSVYSHPGSKSTMGHPNWYGTYLIIALCLAIYRYLSGNQKYWGLLCGVLYASLLASLTRGAWLAFAGVSIGLWFMIKEGKKLTWLAIMFALITLMMAPIKDWKLLGRMGSLKREAARLAENDNRAGSERLELWKGAAELLPDNWLLGSGLDTFNCFIKRGKSYFYTKTHNIVLEMAVTLGLPGLLAYLYIVFRSLIHPCNNLFNKMLRLLLLGYLIQGCFINDTIQSWPVLWIVMGLAVARNQIKAEPEICCQAAC